MISQRRPLSWAIMGTGVVSRKFVQDLSILKDTARVIASRDLGNAEQFVRDVAFNADATDYASAAAHQDVDAVYIATPPSEHEAHALMAIASGKAVLIEKPFAIDASAARRIVNAASAAGVFCMEAMWTRFLPLIGDVRKKLSTDTIGEIRSFQGSFSGSDAPDVQVSLFDPARGGGALLHRGIYPLSLARHFMGPIAEVTAKGRIGPTGVDEDCTLILRHQSGVMSTITASLRAPGRNDILISGTRGMLHIKSPIFRPWRAELSFTTPREAQTGKGGKSSRIRENSTVQRLNQMLPDSLRGFLTKGERLHTPYSGNGYHYEAAETARCLAEGDLTSAIMPLSESIEIMEVVDQARSQFA